MHESYISKKKVSIIIPALDEEKCIEKLLLQFDKDLKEKYSLEVIVSDGGSKDSTVEISKKHAEYVIEYKENYPQNISQGRNAGALKSMGDVLIFLNADVYVNAPEFFLDEVLTEFEDEYLAAIACKIKISPKEEKLSDKAFHFFYNNYVAMLNKFFMGMGRGEAHIIRRKKFEACGGYNEKLIAGEDFDLYKRLRKSGKIKFRRDFVVYESPRRYRRYGYARVFWEWTKNSVSVFMFGKSVSKKWEAVR